MTIISVLAPTMPVRGTSTRPAATGFALPASSGAPIPGVAAPAAMPGLLAMQEAGQGAVRDREARRHGAALLAALTELQRALLTSAGTGPGTTPTDLDRLAALVRSAPPPADPALAAVQRAVLVRAAVELARRTPGPCGTAATVENPFATDC